MESKRTDDVCVYWNMFTNNVLVDIILNQVQNFVVKTPNQNFVYFLIQSVQAETIPY